MKRWSIPKVIVGLAVASARVKQPLLHTKERTPTHGCFFFPKNLAGCGFAPADESVGYRLHPTNRTFQILRQPNSLDAICCS